MSLFYRREFELDEKLIYLNSANQSICPRRVLSRISEYHREYERNPSRGLNEAWGMLWAIQSRLAGFLGADRSDLFLRTNVTSVLNTFLLGVPLPSRSEILVGELEYGAIVNACRLRANRDGLGLRVLKLPVSRLGAKRATVENIVDTVVSQLGPDTRLLLLSHVLGGTGMVMPIQEIAAETRRRDIFLVVDGAYAPGAVPVDFRNLGDIDFYGCSLYKWMLGPKGTAFGWVAKRNQELLEPLSAGWTTFESFGPFGDFGEGSRFQQTFLMAGCHDFAPFQAVGTLLDLWEEWGAANLRSHLFELGARLSEGIERELGWPRVASAVPELRGPLYAHELPDRLQPEGGGLLDRAWKELGIQLNTARIRGRWYAVLSPHVYNTEEELERAVEHLGRSSLRGA